jgi:hypothetical protein
LTRSNVLVVETSIRVAEKTGQIRGACLKLKPPVRLLTPDGTFAAAAILTGADVLHSLDDDLLKLSKSKAVGGLVISKPAPLKWSKSGPGLFT